MAQRRPGETHQQRMARKRAVQLARTGNCSPFGRKLVWASVMSPAGEIERRKIGVER